MKLVPVNAAYFQNAKLLIAADCTAYAYGNFRQDFIRGHVTRIGCPKLDEGGYTEKLTQIIAGSDTRSVTVVRMECGDGLHRRKHFGLTAGEGALHGRGRSIRLEPSRPAVLFPMR